MGFTYNLRSFPPEFFTDFFQISKGNWSRESCWNYFRSQVCSRNLQKCSSWNILRISTWIFFYNDSFGNSSTDFFPIVLSGAFSEAPFWPYPKDLLFYCFTDSYRNCLQISPTNLLDSFRKRLQEFYLKCFQKRSRNASTNSFRK